jgi:hypothetical protein
VFLYLAIFKPFLYGTGFFRCSVEDVLMMLIVVSCFMLEALVVSISNVKRARGSIRKVFTDLFSRRANYWLEIHILWNTRVKYLWVFFLDNRRLNLLLFIDLDGIVSFASKFHPNLKNLFLRLSYLLFIPLGLNVRSIGVFCVISKCASVKVFLDLGNLE